MPRNSGSKMRTNSRHAGAHVPGSGARQPKAIKVHERRGRGHTHRSGSGRVGTAAQLISRALGGR